MQKLYYVDKGATVADSVKIDPFSVIHDDVEIGENTWIGSNVTLFPGTRIGKNCRIFPGAVIAAVPQDLKFSGEYTTAIIGDNTTIRECVTINRGTTDRQTTRVGSNCLIMAYCHIAHDCILGDYVILANSVQLAGHVELGNNAFVGGTSAVHQFVQIGEHAMIGGGSLVRKDVPPYVTAAREPLSYAGLNTLGLRRRGFSNERIFNIQEIYRILFLTSMNFGEALEKLKTDLKDSEDKTHIINFFSQSKRGIIRKGNVDGYEG